MTMKWISEDGGRSSTTVNNDKWMIDNSQVMVAEIFVADLGFRTYVKERGYILFVFFLMINDKQILNNSKKKDLKAL